MPFTIRTKPTLGHTTKKSEMDASIDNENWLNSVSGSIGGNSLNVINGSFEIEGDPDPVGWVFTPHNNGAGEWDNTQSSDGIACYKITSPGGGANGGGTIESEDYIVCPSESYCYLKWWMGCSEAAMRNAVNIRFYDASLVELTPQTIYDEDTNNPTGWTLVARKITIPALAVYMKLQFDIGVLGHATGGYAVIDSISFFTPAPNKYTYASATGTFTPEQKTTSLQIFVKWSQPPPTPQNFGVLTNTPYVDRFAWYEVIGGVGISYDLGTVQIIEYGADN